MNDQHEVLRYIRGEEEEFYGTDFNLENVVGLEILGIDISLKNDIFNQESKDLKYLILRYVNLDDETLKKIYRSYPNLRVLDVTGNEISTLDGLQNLQHLKHLLIQAEESKFDSNGITNIGQLKHLEILKLRYHE